MPPLAAPAAPAALAARNNADWCDLVCRANGVPTRREADRWLSLRRSPPWYPDAVTLTERPRDLLAGLDLSPGCSVKDSFASVDLAPAGFRLLFDATWIYRPPAAPAPRPTPDCRAVRTPDELAVWTAGHGGSIPPALLTEPSVLIVAVYDDGDLVGGAIGNRSDGCVGVSNLFGDVWAQTTAAISARFPGVPLVGYEDADTLPAARAAGFAEAGPLRVWLKD